MTVILFNEETPIELIKSLEPNVSVKGGDYSLQTIETQVEDDLDFAMF